ncbi:MAG TPA: DUF86 domain-containing protein [Anaerolineae bacterium]|nr:DUF86 domain-containing protein [Anaerolineae bacterium]
MAVDRQIIRQRIGFIEHNLELLEQLSERSLEEFIYDAIAVEAAKHLLQTSIEAMIDICSHLVARMRLPMPEYSAGLVDTLVEAGLFPADHAETYKDMIRFRNFLVHMYVKTSDQEIYEILQNALNDFRMFIADAWNAANTNPQS